MNAVALDETRKDEENAINAILQYQEKTGRTRSAIAKELNVSDPQLSQFLNGKYAAPQTLIPKIEQLLKFSEKKQSQPTEPTFKMTFISQQVTNIITYCHLQGKIGVAYGDAGIGKTMAIKEYVRQNPEAIMITISPCFATVTGVNELLAEELRIKEKVSRRIFTEAVNKLKGSSRVVIIDEAQHLTVRVINHLRSITDASGIGIAFVGNEEIYLKMKGTGQAAYAQLFSRIGAQEHLFTSQTRLLDIQMVFEEAHLDEPSLNILHHISKTNYGLRGAVNVFMRTIIGFQILDCTDITAARIAKMAKEMNIA